MKWDELQGYRYARDTLLDTPPALIPQTIRNLRENAGKHPADFQRGMLALLDRLSGRKA